MNFIKLTSLTFFFILTSGLGIFTSCSELKQKKIIYARFTGPAFHISVNLYGFDYPVKLDNSKTKIKGVDNFNNPVKIKVGSTNRKSKLGPLVFLSIPKNSISQNATTITIEGILCTNQSKNKIKAKFIRIKRNQNFLWKLESFTCLK